MIRAHRNLLQSAPLTMQVFVVKGK